jgi:hypothetical protein
MKSAPFLGSMKQRPIKHQLIKQSFSDCQSRWRQRAFVRYLSALFCVVLCLWLGLTAAVQALPMTSAYSLASLHTYHELPGQTTFRSKQSLRDRRDRAWQVILFKRYQGNDLEGIYLRLVGFPGILAVDAQQPATIATGTSTQWQASPGLDPQTVSLPDNAVQYDVSRPLAELQDDIPLQIDIPLADGSKAQLVVPPFAVEEWRSLYKSSPA